MTKLEELAIYSNVLSKYGEGRGIVPIVDFAALIAVAKAAVIVVHSNDIYGNTVEGLKGLERALAPLLEEAT